MTLVLAVPAAYALARLTGHWGRRAGILVFLVYLVPPTLLFISMFRIVVGLGLRNSFWSLVLVDPTITVPFSMWLLTGFFKSIPRELDTVLVRGDVFFWQSLLAATAIVAIPVGLVYNLFLDRLVQGFTIGAVKG